MHSGLAATNFHATTSNSTRRDRVWKARLATYAAAAVAVVDAAVVALFAHIRTAAGATLEAAETVLHGGERADGFRAAVQALILARGVAARPDSVISVANCTLRSDAAARPLFVDSEALRKPTRSSQPFSPAFKVTVPA